MLQGLEVPDGLKSAIFAACTPTAPTAIKPADAIILFIFFIFLLFKRVKTKQPERFLLNRLNPCQTEIPHLFRVLIGCFDSFLHWTFRICQENLTNQALRSMF